MKMERIRIRLTSAWDKSIIVSPHGIKSFGQEVCEVDSPTPELPWEGELVGNIVSSLSNVHIATRTHETGYLSQLVSSLASPPLPKTKVLPQVYR